MMNSTTVPDSRRGFRHSSMRLVLAALLGLGGLAGGSLHAQAIPTASDDGALQIGGMYSVASSGYHLDDVNPGAIKGGGAYVTFDFRLHIGIEAEFHQLSNSDPLIGIYERTYEIGPRYVLRYGRFNPYAKVMFGRGVLNFPSLTAEPNAPPAANLAYNMAAVGAGLDYRWSPSFNIRAEYEYQRWFGFPTNGLSPGLASVGVAYRFH